MPIGLLLAMQAAGMIVDYMGVQEQSRLARMGYELEQAGINANIETSRVEAENASLEAMKKLRQTLGSQAALFAARGVRAGTGNAIIASTESVGNFNANERIRKLNQMQREANLKAGGVLSKLHEQANENNMWNQFAQRTINRIPTSPSAYKGIGESFGFTKV
jgi:urease accessory protein UreF